VPVFPYYLYTRARHVPNLSVPLLVALVALLTRSLGSQGGKAKFNFLDAMGWAELWAALNETRDSAGVSYERPGAARYRSLLRCQGRDLTYGVRG
jgi:hypothetical protein